MSEINIMFSNIILAKSTYMPNMINISQFVWCSPSIFKVTLIHTYRQTIRFLWGEIQSLFMVKKLVSLNALEGYCFGTNLIYVSTILNDY